MSDARLLDPIAEARRQWQAHWGGTATPAMAAVTSIMRVQQILMGRLNETLKPLGLTFPRYEALMILHLSRRGSLPMGKIGERLQVHPTSVTSLIDGLERTGYILRVPHDSDRRATLAQITAAGRRTAEAATNALNEARFHTDPLRKFELEAISDLLRPLRARADGFAES
jgi:DNA-binding MarR family transcriptional regulator